MQILHKLKPCQLVQIVYSYRERSNDAHNRMINHGLHSELAGFISTSKLSDIQWIKDIYDALSREMVFRLFSQKSNIRAHSVNLRYSSTFVLVRSV